ncbi:rRNA methyltransferase 3, mitochondrial [Aedes aegypti]|uniref:RNA 2-O ribose methyltransferase substrate binding domain-containing protein n=1 Tax=Aedes aegypti TaxID=7159 RepID=A0A1S4FLG4_AEDAE|nr:rRNA methyltransferase 3, mitochondrial [Aedes aegypti]
MQFTNRLRILAFNIVTGTVNSARHVHNGNTILQRISLPLRHPRGNSRTTSHLDVHMQPERNGGGAIGQERERVSDVNRAEFSANRGRSDEAELEEIENNLFDNRQSKDDLHLGEIMKKYKNDFRREEINRSQSKPKKSSKPIRLGEMDLETMHTLKPYKRKEKSLEITDKHSGIKYLKLLKNDPMFGDMQLLMTSRKRRELKSKLVVEGKRLINDAIDAGLLLETVIFSESCHLDDIRAELATPKLIQLPNHVLQEWSDLVTSPGVIGIFQKPSDMSKIVIRNRTAESLPITVVCDNVREPNNLGSILRSCASIPVDRVILLKGCTHPWDPKCLRGGAGAHFRTSIVGPVVMDELAELLPSNPTFLVADNRSERDEESFVLSRYDKANYFDMEHMVLVIGGETHGVSSDVRRYIRQLQEDSNVGKSLYLVHIPLENGVESLNTASAISVILCEIRRQLNPKE